MSVDLAAEQEREWDLLHDGIREALRQHGAEDARGEADYSLMDDNLGHYRHRIETENADLLRPAVIAALRDLLLAYPNWEIVLTLVGCGGVIIRDDEIIDGLRRKELPSEFQALVYEGSRPLGSRFGDIMYSGFSLSLNAGAPFSVRLPDDTDLMKFLK
jgi:hypothetical protein